MKFDKKKFLFWTVLITVLLLVIYVGYGLYSGTIFLGKSNTNLNETRNILKISDATSVLGFETDKLQISKPTFIFDEFKDLNTFHIRDVFREGGEGCIKYVTGYEFYDYTETDEFESLDKKTFTKINLGTTSQEYILLGESQSYYQANNYETLDKKCKTNELNAYFFVDKNCKFTRLQIDRFVKSYYTELIMLCNETHINIASFDESGIMQNMFEYNKIYTKG